MMLLPDRLYVTFPESPAETRRQLPLDRRAMIREFVFIGMANRLVSRFRLF